MDRPRPAHPAADRGEAFLVKGLRVVPNAGRISGPGADEQVDPKVMDVLVALARRPGEYVSREQLIDEVWPDRVVTDNVLSRCVYELRKHLVSAGGSRKYKALLETLPKRGYRLNAEVVPDPPTSQSLAKPRPAEWRGIMLLAALGVMVAGAWWALDRAGDGRIPEVHALGPVTVAVLPFVDLSAEGDQEYFADGVSEELINVLTRIPELQVIARSSSFWFKGRNPDIATVAEKLNVTHVLEGSVRRSDDRIRITAQLIDAAGSVHLWSDTYDREFGDIFAIQDEIALAVAEKLELAFRGDGPALTAHSPDPEAYVLNLHAWFLFNRRAPGDLDHAAAYYRRALEIDPEYAAAWAGLAGVHFIQAWDDERDLASGLALAREAAERAVDLEPTLPEARARLARVLNTIGERDAGTVHMAKAVKYGQDSPLVLSMQAGYAWSRRDFDEAIALNRRAAALDPLNVVIRENLATHLASAGRLEEAEHEVRVALEIRPEGDSWGHLSRRLADILILQRRPVEALALIANWPDGSARDRALALIRAMDGQPDPFEKALARLVARADLASAISLAHVYAFTGDTDAAFRWLDIARERLDVESTAHPVFIRIMQTNVNTSPFLDPLRLSPRWQDWQASW
jgi:adenylate cyclase